MATNVTINQIARQGKIALVLNWTDNGKRRQEATKLYLLTDKSAEAKAVNKATLKAAERLRAKKELELAEDKVADKSPVLLTYFTTIRKRRQQSENFAWNTTDKWIQAQKKLEGYLKSIDKQDLKLNELTIGMLEGYKDWLFDSCDHGNKKLSPVSVNIYTSKLSCVLGYAHREDLISNKIASYQLRLKEDKPVVQYLTQDQVEALEKAPCREPFLKEAFLFSCNTGLRISDVSQLTWSNISMDESLMRITTQKTKTRMEQPLNAKALSILAELPKDNELVFGTLLRRRGTIRRYLIEWFNNAGIDNVRPHFHLSRDTFANGLLGKGIDLKVVSVLLSHSSISTTERHYIGRLSNQTLSGAVNKL